MCHVLEKGGCLCRILVGRTEGKRPIGRPRSRCKKTIKKDLENVEWGGMDSTDLAEDRDRSWALVNAVMNHRVQ